MLEKTLGVKIYNYLKLLLLALFCYPSFTTFIALAAVANEANLFVLSPTFIEAVFVFY